MTARPQSFDADVRHLIYRHFVDNGRAPTIAEAAALLAVPPKAIAQGFERLAAGKALVLQPSSGEVLMAEPFSAVPTAFRVVSGDRWWWANCTWDALGVLAALKSDGRVETSCGDCGEALRVDVAEGQVQGPPSVVHYVVPAKRWWEDVVFT